MLIHPFPKLEHIHAVAIPLPDDSDLRTANLYALGNGPVTLIDTGPKFPGVLEFLEDRLKGRGLGIRDVERIIITHGHIDHYGLAETIRQAAGRPVEVLIHALEAWRVQDDRSLDEMWSEDSERMMVMAGIPERERERVRRRFALFKQLCDPLRDVSVFEEGDAFGGEGYELSIIHTPGHTPGACCMYESCEKVLFSGDHVIKHITPNPLMEINREHLPDPDYKSLAAYLHSLDKLLGLDVRYVFPGHGEYIRDLKGIVSSYRLHHQERMEIIWKALRKAPRPLYNLIEEVFPYVPEGHVFIAISEIVVHLEVLVEEGRAELADPGPPVLYRAIP